MEGWRLSLTFSNRVPTINLAVSRGVYGIYAVRFGHSCPGGRLQPNGMPASGQCPAAAPRVVICCAADIDAILQAIMAFPAQIAIINIDRPRNESHDMTLVRRFHLAHPEISKIVLINSGDREVVVNAFRSGARGHCSASTTILSGSYASAFWVFIKARCGRTASNFNISSKP